MNITNKPENRHNIDQRLSDLKQKFVGRLCPRGWKVVLLLFLLVSYWALSLLVFIGFCWVLFDSVGFIGVVGFENKNSSLFRKQK